ncbi:MAG: CpaF family protein, partial [Acidimicrobiales bacterium]|nr:CpaF family protein [Acidimicrobiales bacterium]
NGAGPVWVERHGRLVPTDIVLDERTVTHLIERVVAPLGLRIDRSSPLVDARLPDGSRVNAVIPPLAVDGPCLTIRRFAARPVDLDEVCPPGVAPLLRWAVSARANLVICGGAGAGKTTLLNALAGSIPAGERVVTIEDAAELRLPGPHVVRLEARPPNAEGVGEVTIRDLVRNALRMRPDRIIVGEARGGEVADMVQAMSTGHDGSLSTCHANGAAEALRRLELLALLGGIDLPLTALRAHLAGAVDLVVAVARRPDGSRRVTAVEEVVPEGAAAGPGGDGPPGAPTRPLADARGLVALPRRPVRSVGAPPANPAWLVAA